MPEDVNEVPATIFDVSLMPRIEPLSYEHADEATREVWDQMVRTPDDPRLGRFSDHVLFRTFMHHPELYKVYSPFVRYLMNSTCLPLRHREIAILRSAWNCGADDQWVNHTKIGLVCGLTQADIDRVAAEGPGPGWSAEESVVLQAVDELHRTCQLGDQTWAALARQYDTRQLVEFLLLVGNYRTLAYVHNSVGIRPATDVSPNIPGNRFQFPGP